MLILIIIAFLLLILNTIALRLSLDLDLISPLEFIVHTTLIEKGNRTLFLEIITVNSIDRKGSPFSYQDYNNTKSNKDSSVPTRKGEKSDGRKGVGNGY